MTNAPFPSLNFFNHTAPSTYFKTKGKVDGSTQYRAMLRSPSGVLKWEENIVPQTFRTLSINVFIAYRMLAWSEFMDCAGAFGDVNI